MSEDLRWSHFFLREVRRCPETHLQDLRKGLFQAVMGCEHLLPPGPQALDEAEAALRAEVSALPETWRAPEIAPLPGPWGRANLSLLRRGLAPRTLAAAFLASGHCPGGSVEELSAGAAVLAQLVEDGRLPYPAAEARREIARWQAAGFAPCHHSEAYRRACRPAYRVLHRHYLRLVPLLKTVDGLLARFPRVFLAVEGPCGSGKTTLASHLAQLYDAAVFHADDFFLRPCQRTPERLSQPGGNMDRQRLEEEILRPLRRGDPAVFRPYDCKADALLPPRTVPPRRLNVVEGVYSFHPALAAYYHAAVFLDISPREQRRRLERRCGREGAAVYLHRWIPLEEAYFSAADTRRRCTLVLGASHGANKERREEL